MLYLVGLGLCDPSDITVKGLEVVKKASRVYLEAYTSILIASTKEELVGVKGYRRGGVVIGVASSLHGVVVILHDVYMR